ncbi:hypothetical protein CBR_g22291 [Chara braunii]|uniref:Retrotransposon gag domain-containing protein n=1 Tax=Chara braunii TaxID=69332 RepID=A0A388L2W3_CHABU|nr:hypothetical protein CBR_g22291 [Chara braunii]|eukprot:GBG76543.1 hypothetical protein CBR_g22291 [Chara braunii]
MLENIADGAGKVLTIDDLVEVMDMRKRFQSNVPKVNTFHFNGVRVSEWLELVEQVLKGPLDVVKFQRILKYVLHGHHQEVEKVINAANGNWARFKDGMQRKYMSGHGLLTTADLEAMNKDDFTMVETFVQEFKKKGSKVPGISEEAQCAIFLGLFTASEASELTSHGGGSAKLTWATIDNGVEEGSLDQVEQYQMCQQRRKRKERDATSSGTSGVKRIVTNVLAELAQGRMAQVAQTRGQSKASASRELPRRESESERRKEAVEAEEEDDEDEQDDRLRQEEDRRAEQRAKKTGAHEKVEPILRGAAPKKKKYVVQLEEGFDLEKVIDRLLEGHNDLVTFKKILAYAPKLRNELKGRFL